MVLTIFPSVAVSSPRPSLPSCDTRKYLESRPSVVECPSAIYSLCSFLLPRSARRKGEACPRFSESLAKCDQSRLSSVNFALESTEMEGAIAESELKPRAGGVQTQEPAAWDLKAYLAVKIKAVNEALNLAVPVVHPELIHEAMRYALFGGGKRLCSIVSIAVCELFGGDENAVMPIACALEMIHDASLVHDDLPCMDDSALRRARPTTHLVFGVSTAVLTGDALICRAFEHVARETRQVASERVLRTIALLGKSVGSQGMVAGQIVDLESTGNSATTLETLEFIHLHKTAVLVECSTACGAIVAGASEEDVETLTKFGRTLGLLFQVVDDLLDATKSAEEIGKPAGVDALADKATYPKLLGLEQTRLFAKELSIRAKAEISKFDPVRAAPLISIVEYVMNRPR